MIPRNRSEEGYKREGKKPVRSFDTTRVTVEAGPEESRTSRQTRITRWLKHAWDITLSSLPLLGLKALRQKIEKCRQHLETLQKSEFWLKSVVDQEDMTQSIRSIYYRNP